ncbi:PH domain-containing protein [Lentibacillus cibarius]|uniref:PH domain-containing protein n=1 Tax=Lentibacillus cibarius TaxID=2583219 RepID=A0A549YGM0_9BACI|nr:PH domain-containing protein [Lentibacillus cibarius]TRM11036.1 PH domain-containing protein [Lentibacillus cibarius]
MEGDLHSQGKHISKKMITVWRIRQTIRCLTALLVIYSFFFINHYFNWFSWLPIVSYSLTSVVVVYAIWSILFKPVFDYNHWRYHIDEQHVRLKYGRINETFVITPMTKIQLVSTKQGPILRKYNLYTINIETLGPSLTIPGLQKEQARKLSSQIADFAQAKEIEL